MDGDVKAGVQSTEPHPVSGRFGVQTPYTGNGVGG